MDKKAINDILYEIGGFRPNGPDFNVSSFDLEPTKDSNNAVFSGGVHKYIEDKFIVLTPEEYESLVIKNSNTFYFILDDSN